MTDIMRVMGPFVCLVVAFFLNRIIDRLPIIINQNWLLNTYACLNIEHEASDSWTFWKPKSACFHCQQSLTHFEQIPILSFLLHLGHCRHCQKWSRHRHFIIELLCLLAYFLIAACSKTPVEFFYSLIFIAFILVIGAIDLEHQIIPDGLNYGLLWFGLIASSYHQGISADYAIKSALIGYLILFLPNCIYSFLSSGKMGMGHGDFKLLAALGACLGLLKLIYVVVMALLFFGIISVFYVFRTPKKLNHYLPFGPFICMAAMIMFFSDKFSILAFLYQF